MLHQVLTTASMAALVTRTLQTISLLGSTGTGVTTGITIPWNTTGTIKITATIAAAATKIMVIPATN